MGGNPKRNVKAHSGARDRNARRKPGNTQRTCPPGEINEVNEKAARKMFLLHRVVV